MVQETMHIDALHFGYVEHCDVHNAYGYLFHMGSADGLLNEEVGMIGHLFYHVPFLLEARGST